MKLIWSIEGEVQLARKLEVISAGVKDWTEAFTQAADKLKSQFSNEVFSTRGAILGERWDPLKPKYLARKLKQGFPTDPLIKTGKMKNSFYSNAFKDYAEIGNSAEYFKYHQSKEPRSKIPRRVMMKLGTKQKEIVVKIFHEFWYYKTQKN